MEARPAFNILVLGLLALGASVVVALTPHLWFADRLTLHVELDTAVSLAAAFAALLVLGRLRLEPGLDFLLLCSGLLVLAGSSLLYAAIPDALADGSSLYFGRWAPLLTGAVGSALFAAAGLLSPRPLRRRRPGQLALGIAAGVLGLTATAVEALRPVLAGGIPAQALARNPDPFVASTPVIVVHTVTALLWVVATGAFVRKAERSGDALAAWVAGGALLLVFARLQYLLFPSAYPHWFYLGDAFRAGGYLMFAVGGVRELMTVWGRLADVAVLEERRRLARDLHDGLAQELAYVCAESDGELRAAAQRALDESRRAIAALAHSEEEAVGLAIAQAAEEVGQRLGVAVELVVDEAAEAAPEVREELVRIAREAVANAARHAGTDRVRVELAGGRALRLRVEDHGCGFDPEQPQAGHGLVSMRERARALGATLSVSSGRSGTIVEVQLA